MDEINFFTARIPKRVVKKLDEEASEKRRSRNDQIIRILEERYGFVAEREEQARPAKKIA